MFQFILVLIAIGALIYPFAFTWYLIDWAVSDRPFPTGTEWGALGLSIVIWIGVLAGYGQRKEAAPSTVAQRPRREPIPERVRHEVWRRDQGRCVDCGSRERLEFDHIVPLSRGGSNTVRNIELRCEPCNRGKGARI